MQNDLFVQGRYELVCTDANGNVKWTDSIDNLTCTGGLNYALDQYLGLGNPITGPFLGLISGQLFTTGPAATDRMDNHLGWKEAGAAHTPTYFGTRKTCVWASAIGGIKSLSSPLTFTMTGPGSIRGGFIVLGNAATNAIDSSSGILYSAGTFTEKSVISGDKISVFFTATLGPCTATPLFALTISDAVLA